MHPWHLGISPRGVLLCFWICPKPSLLMFYLGPSHLRQLYPSLMVPAAILLLFFSSFFWIFLFVSCGLSAININNLGNCLLLLKSIPVLLLLSAGPGPKNRYDGAQTKQVKCNESRGDQALRLHHPVKLDGSAQSLRNPSTEFWLKSFLFQSSPTRAMVLVRLKEGAPQGPCYPQGKAA